MGLLSYPAVIFDLDGTLLDTLDDLADSTNHALRARGFPEHPAESYKIFVGDGVRELVRRAFPPSAQDEDSIADGVDAVRTEYKKRWRDKTQPYPGIPELLGSLRERGVRLCILSNKPQEYTDLTVSALLSSWKFEVVRGARPDTPLKPDPAGARAVLDALRLPPGKVLYVGDTGTDMRTAVAAGLRPIGVLWGFRGALELEEAGAARLVKAPNEILEELS